jgi:hypothetical protein
MSVTNVSVGQVELCDAVSGSSVKMWVCTETTAKEMLRLTSEVFAKPVSGFLTFVLSEFSFRISDSLTLFSFVSSGDGLLIPASVISSDPTLFHDTSLFVVCAGEQTTELVAAHARRFMEETEDAEGDEQFDETLDDDLYDAPQNYDDEDLAYEPEVDVDAGQENNGGKRSLTLTRTEEELGEEDYLAQLDRENKQLQVPISPSAAALQAQSEEYEKLRQTWLTMKLEELMKVERDLEDAEEEAIAIRQLQQQQQRRQQSNTQSASNQYEDNDDASADAPFESHDDIDDPMLDDEDEYEQQMEQELSEAMERQRLAQATKRAVQNAANYPPQTPNSAAQVRGNMFCVCGYFIEMSTFFFNFRVHCRRRMLCWRLPSKTSISLIMLTKKTWNNLSIRAINATRVPPSGRSNTANSRKTNNPNNDWTMRPLNSSRVILFDCREDFIFVVLNVIVLEFCRH